MHSVRKFSTPPSPAQWGRHDRSEQTAIAARIGTPKILFVDDEPQVLAGLRRCLSDYPYEVHTASSSELALQKLCEEPFDVVVSDECMPGMPGSELLTVIAHEFPFTGRILLTGNGTISAAARAVNEASVLRLLLKPCPVTDLRDAIELALNSTPLERQRGRGKSRRAYLVSRHGAQTRDPSAQTGKPAAPGRRQLLTLHRHQQWEANELVLQAQKVVDLTSQDLFGYELSTRLQAQAGDSHTVGNFMGSAEQQVPMAAVDRWVVRHVFKVVREHRSALEAEHLSVSLNIAAQSLADPEFLRRLDLEILDSGAAPRVLIEVRESALVKSLRKDESLPDQLRRMKCIDAGARLCIDGAGSVLTMLPAFRSLPIGLAKIDSALAANVLDSQRVQDIIGTAVAWGLQSGVAIAATGVDSPAIAERLLTLGVRYGQGTAFGAAEPVGSAFAKTPRAAAR
jgi:EAL domain-containing protein (putative c-di-GMP-specific phosphodiesterase class I)/DNA-binding NarL/FixJ family response regulator